jgi:hypothetical protein
MYGLPPYIGSRTTRRWRRSGNADCLVGTDDEEEKMIDSYFLITSDEDGTVVRGPYTRDHLLSLIEPDEDGDLFFGPLRFVAEIPPNDGGYWQVPETAIIVKGEIVVPEPVEKVVKLRLP